MKKINMPWHPYFQSLLEQKLSAGESARQGTLMLPRLTFLSRLNLIPVLFSLVLLTNPVYSQYEWVNGAFDKLRADMRADDERRRAEERADEAAREQRSADRWERTRRDIEWANETHNRWLESPAGIAAQRAEAAKQRAEQAKIDKENRACDQVTKASLAYCQKKASALSAALGSKSSPSSKSGKGPASNEMDWKRLDSKIQIWHSQATQPGQ